MKTQQNLIDDIRTCVVTQAIISTEGERMKREAGETVTRLSDLIKVALRDFINTTEAHVAGRGHLPIIVQYDDEGQVELFIDEEKFCIAPACGPINYTLFVDLNGPSPIFTIRLDRNPWREVARGCPYVVLKMYNFQQCVKDSLTEFEGFGTVLVDLPDDTLKLDL